MRTSAIAAALLLVTAPASARDLTIVSWKLGWYLDRSSAADWIAACNGMFEKDAAGVWKPSPTGTLPGWQVNFRDPVEWDWARFLVCDGYKDFRSKTVPVTAAAYDKRLQQLNDFMQNNVPADIYAFQEVSGRAAVLDALPDSGSGYDICTFDTYKVQRLAIAWKKELGAGTSCSVRDDLSLPANPDADRPRPGLSVDLC